MDERDLVNSMRKLDLIKELGDKQNQFQRLQDHLHQTNDVITRESQVLREFRKELDQLVQERMSHIEELRLIHADINLMETTIKQTEEQRTRILQESKTLLKDYQPMKERINQLREILNLDKLPETEDDETSLQLLSQQSTESDVFSHRPMTDLVDSFSLPMGLSFPKVLSTSNSTLDRTTFRQQPPPMKTCQSCQQQIHRNAPICPICKAKSRSRNPKKPKRRHIDLSSSS